MEKFDVSQKEKSGRSFEEQWKNPERITIDKQEIGVWDIIPENQKTEVPAIIGLGWSETPRAHKGNIKIFSEQGRRIIAPDTPHGIDTEPLENYPAIELRKMAALVRTLEEKGVEKADIIAHSEGAIFSVIAARLYPEKFRNLVLVDPAGMIGEDNLGRLGVGFSLDLIKQVISEIKKGKPSEGQTTGMLDFLTATKVIGGSPLRSIKEVLAIANSDLREMLKEIKNKHIGVAVISGVRDEVFPMEKMQKVISSEHVDGFYSVDGSHNSYFLDPKPYSLMIDNALDTFEKREVSGK